MLIDTHFHIDLETDNMEEIIEEANANDVKKLILSGCDKKGIKEAVEIVNKHKNIYATIGFHPSEVDKITKDDIKYLEQLIITNPKIIGIGEIGLDYYWVKDNKEVQKELFRAQLTMAERLDLPIVIHTRDAFQDTYDILKEYSLKGIIHSFSGKKENANAYISLGYRLGIGGVLTFKNSNLSTVIKEIPLSNIVLETDSPYLAPEPFRGRKNSPKNIRLIALKLADIYLKELEEIAKITSSNVDEIFDLK